MFAVLLISQMAMARNIDVISSFKLAKLNRLSSVLLNVIDLEISGNCGGISRVSYSDENLHYAAAVAASSSKYTEDLRLSKSDFETIKRKFDDLIANKEQEAIQNNDKVVLKYIADARNEISTINLLDNVKAYSGASIGEYNKTIPRLHLVLLDTANKEVFAFSDSFCR